MLDSLSPLTSLDDLSSSASSAVSSAVSSAASSAVSSATSGVSSWFTANGSRIVAILLGLLLVAAGIFSFDKTRELVETAGKTAAAAA